MIVIGFRAVGRFFKKSYKECPGYNSESGKTFQRILFLFSFSNISFLKGTPKHIWKSRNIFVFIWKYYVEDHILKHLLLFEICTRKICEKFVYKHSEIIKYVKN